MDDQLPKGMNRIKDLGPVGDLARERLRTAREKRGLTAVDLSALARAYGRDLSPVAIRRIEYGARRIDVDDLLILAAALDLSPLAFLLPMGETGQENFAPSRTLEGEELEAWWMWAHGEMRLHEDPARSLDEFREESVPSWFVSEARDLEQENKMLTELTRSLLRKSDG